MVTKCDSDGKCSIANIEILSPKPNKLLQSWADTISDEFPFMHFSEMPKFIDFNFDGYQDICFEAFFSGYDPVEQLTSFRQYNPKTNLFDVASQFNGVEGAISLGDNNTIEAYIPMGCARRCWIKNIYKYVGMKLVFVKQVESAWDEKERDYIETERNEKR